MPDQPDLTSIDADLTRTWERMLDADSVETFKVCQERIDWLLDRRLDAAKVTA